MTTESAQFWQNVRRGLGMIQSGIGIIAEAIGRDEDYLASLVTGRASGLGEQLTEAELDVLVRLAVSDSVEEIASRRDRSVRTISNQITRALPKVGFRDRREFRGWIRSLHEVEIPEKEGT